ncbi:UvrB/UvrC motif-containing protein [Archangium lansingense]|uniref:UvrB/UvrC motif-containing protein n=1 Tax=Archangium lansingense TaxID=2995310 RepID=A0ABT4A5H6_9BACT|nr:UvrB/UvrC motif-containing protein [Archangium lansinium]MCY1076904.1 UvrB/UvrC motif-containing protein [Archangium lansinium]
MSARRLEQLREDVRARAENRPGVYRMKGPSEEVLYVGKSVKVRTRLLSYFRAQRGEKGAEIIGHAHGVEWDYVPSEFAALLEEFRLIKRWRPLYNVEHKRDNLLCFIKLTREAVPRLLVVGQVINDGAEYFGPLRGRHGATEAVRAVSDLLELRDCSSDTPMRLADQIELFRQGEDPRCMRGQVGRCLSPCAGGCTRIEYLARVSQARDFLNGVTDQPLALLRERMSVASRRLQFEFAAELRDRAATLERVQAELLQIGQFVEQLSFVYTVPGHDGEDRAYVIRRGSVRAELVAPRTPNERRALAAMVGEIFERPALATIGLRAHEAQEVLLVARWFRLNPEELERTVPAASFSALGPGLGSVDAPSPSGRGLG